MIHWIDLHDFDHDRTRCDATGIMGIGFGNHPQMALFHSISGLFHVSRIGGRNYFGWTMTIGGYWVYPNWRECLWWPLMVCSGGIGFTWVYTALPHHTGSQRWLCFENFPATDETNPASEGLPAGDFHWWSLIPLEQKIQNNRVPYAPCVRLLGL